MSEEEEQYLKKLCINGYKLCWFSDMGEAFIVSRVGNGPPVAEDDVPEPSLCAFFHNGKYAALYHCELEEFKIMSDIKM